MSLRILGSVGQLGYEVYAEKPMRRANLRQSQVSQMGEVRGGKRSLRGWGGRSVLREHVGLELSLQNGQTGAEEAARRQEEERCQRALHAGVGRPPKLGQQGDQSK